MTYTHVIGGQPLSIIDAFTATNIELNTSLATGLIIPVTAAPGSTLTFFIKSDQGYNRQIPSTILDARASLQGTLLGEYGERGPLTARTSGKFYVNGADVGYYDCAVVFNSLPAGRYYQFAIRFADIPRQDGFIYLYMNSQGQEGQQPLHFADVRLYDYALTPAQLAQPLLPRNYEARYTFADYQAGDSQAVDVSGNGNHAVIFY